MIVRGNKCLSLLVKGGKDFNLSPSLHKYELPSAASRILGQPYSSGGRLRSTNEGLIQYRTPSKFSNKRRALTTKHQNGRSSGFT